MKKICLVPFFGGLSSAANSKKENRFLYLEKCLKSLKDDFEIIVGVCNDQDEETLAALSHRVVKFLCDPIFLPSTFICWAQENIDCDYILITEADQVYESDWEKIISSLVDGFVMSPHRIEVSGSKKRPGINVTYNGIDYVAPNTMSTKNGSDKFFVEKEIYLAFGGAFLCSKNDFNKIKVSFSSNLPIEHATGFDAFNCFPILKSEDLFLFFCDHLSGEEFNA